MVADRKTMITENEEGRGVYNSFNEWAAQVYHIRIIHKISTDYLRTLRSEMLHVIGQIDNELKERGSSR